MKENEYTWLIIYLFFISKRVTIDLEIRIVSRSYFAGLSAFFLVLFRSKMVIQKVEDEFRHRP